MADIATNRIGWALAVAAGAALAALIAPPLALLILAALAARLCLGVGAAHLEFRWRDIAPPIIAAFAVGAFLGLAAGVGMFFVWRVIADTRWSQREAARLAAIAGLSRPRWTRAHMWLTPAFALAMVAYTAPHMVAGLPLDLPHIPFWAPLALGVAATLALLDWTLRLAAEWRLGSLAGAPAAHEFTHHLIFILAYAATQDISAGLVALIAWRLAYAERGAPQASFTAVP